MKLRMKDNEKPTIETMRGLFERTVTSTPVLANNLSLGVAEEAGKFSHYTNQETDTMWVGFAIGMRCSQRIINALQLEPA